MTEPPLAATDFAALYGAIACGVLLVEPRGTILYANRAAEALVSPDRAFGEVEGLRWVDPGGLELDALIA